MNDVTYLPLNTPSVKSYVFRAVLESGDTGWYARCLALAAYSASAWGETQEAALRRLQRTVETIVADLLSRGEALPEGVVVAFEPLVSVVTR
jgi:predicted RNase H-like HicB family nuclease